MVYFHLALNHLRLLPKAKPMTVLESWRPCDFKTTLTFYFSFPEVWGNDYLHTTIFIKFFKIKLCWASKIIHLTHNQFSIKSFVIISSTIPEQSQQKTKINPKPLLLAISNLKNFVHEIQQEIEPCLIWVAVQNIYSYSGCNEC